MKKNYTLAADLPKGDRPVVRRTPEEIAQREAERTARMNRMPRPKNLGKLAADIPKDV